MSTILSFLVRELISHVIFTIVEKVVARLRQAFGERRAFA